MSNEAVSQILESATPATTEAKPVDAAVPAEQKDPRVSSRLEVLMRREQAAVSREKAADLKLKELDQALAKIKEFDALKEHPTKALEHLGFSNDDFARTTLNDGEVPPEVKLKKFEEKFDKHLSELDQEKKRAELDKQADLKAKETEAEDAFKTEIKSYVSEHSDRYEYVLFENQEGLIYDVVDAHYNRTIDPKTGVGKIMKISDAADKVEAWLEKKEAEKKQLKKSQALWGAIPKTTLDKLAKPEEKPRRSPRTLTNQMSASTSTPRPQPITDEERVKRAIAFARGLRA